MGPNPVVLVPGLIASGEDAGTAAEAWENGGYFPSLGAELRVGYFLFQGPLTCSLSPPLPPHFPYFRRPSTAFFTLLAAP